MGALHLRRCCAAALVVLAAGCLDPIRDYLRAHPDTPYQVAVAMKQEKVVPGMIKEAVRTIWGSPESVEHTGKKTESWRYTRHFPGMIGSGYFGGYIISFRGEAVCRVHYLGRTDGRTW